MGTTTFSKLQVGDLFDFDRSTLKPGYRLINGPFVKTSPRKYRLVGADNRPTGFEMRMGTTRVTVVRP